MTLRGDRDLDVHADVRLARHEPHLLVAKTAGIDHGDVALDCARGGRRRRRRQYLQRRRRQRQCRGGDEGRLVLQRHLRRRKGSDRLRGSCRGGRDAGWPQRGRRLAQSLASRVQRIRAERLRQRRIGQIGRTLERQRPRRRVLREEARPACLVAQAGRQVDADHDALEPVANEQALRQPGGPREVHDAALEALVDEAGIQRIAGRQRRRQTPHLERQVRQH